MAAATHNNIYYIRQIQLHIIAMHVLLYIHTPIVMCTVFYLHIYVIRVHIYRIKVVYHEPMNHLRREKLNDHASYGINLQLLLLITTIIKIIIIINIAINNYYCYYY